MTIKIVNRSAMFQAVNIVASKLQGDKSAKMKFAYAIVTNGNITLTNGKTVQTSLKDVNTLFNREEMTKLIKLVVSAGIEHIKSSEQKPKKAPKDKKVNAPKVEKAPKAPKSEKMPEPLVRIDFQGLPENIIKLFPDSLMGLNSIITKYVYNANQTMNALHMDAKRFNFKKGMEELQKITSETSIFPNGKKETKITPFQRLQCIMMTHFMTDIVKYQIKKYIDLGVNHKNVETRDRDTIEKEESYQNASSNDGRIRDYDVEDLFNTLLVDAFRLTFSREMFHLYVDENGDNKLDKQGFYMTNVNKSLYFRIANMMKLQMGKLKKQTKVVAEIKSTYTETYTNENGNKVKIEKAYELETSKINALEMAIDMGIFTELEIQIIELRLKGYQKNEIDKIVGKRTDRDFARIAKKYSEVA